MTSRDDDSTVGLRDGDDWLARGNVRVCGEFNFVTDPEAAAIVLSHFTCPTHIATLEYSLRHHLPWDFYQKWVNQDTKKARFIKKISAHTAKFAQGDQGSKEQIFGLGFVSCDSYAMAAAIDDSVVTERANYGVSVEMSGSLTRGMMVVDTLDILKLKHKAVIFLECDMEKFKQLLTDALK
ncbi:nucleoside hydrolase-like [Mobula birostris]|uniref:nucleoside hydrolase-like n=1 Tax=Mobula birostris TaxID=1983395 RepID=UPI003B28B0E7